MPPEGMQARSVATYLTEDQENSILARERIESELPIHVVGRRYPAGTRRIIRVNRPGHQSNALEGTSYPTCLLIQDGQPEEMFHHIYHADGMLCEYLDPTTGRKVVGIVTYGEVVGYTDPKADNYPESLILGC